MKTSFWAIMIVVFVTLLTSSAQMLYKFSANKLELDFYALITNYYLFSGLFLYGIGAIFLIIALKYGEVSVLYPIIATSYVWVAVMAWLFAGESLSLLKIAGIALIVVGVAAIGVGGGRAK